MTVDDPDGFVLRDNVPDPKGPSAPVFGDGRTNGVRWTIPTGWAWVEHPTLLQRLAIKVAMRLLEWASPKAKTE